jgi:hypothetical protein
MKDRYDFSKGKRGPVVKVPEGKEKITIHLDSDILNWFRHVVDEAGAAITKRSSTMRCANTLRGRLLGSKIRCAELSGKN